MWHCATMKSNSGITPSTEMLLNAIPKMLSIFAATKVELGSVMVSANVEAGQATGAVVDGELGTVGAVIIVYCLKEVSGLAGWCVALGSVLLIPIYAIQMLVRSKGTLMQRIRDNCRPSNDWGPADPEMRHLWKAAINKQRNKDIKLNNFDKS